MIFTICFALLTVASIGVQGGPRCPSKDGRYPVYIPDEDCTKFWECSNGTPYLFNCPANLHFNPKLNVCDWPDRAGCEGSNSSGSDSDSSDSSSSSESKESKEADVLHIV